MLFLRNMRKRSNSLSKCLVNSKKIQKMVKLTWLKRSKKCHRSKMVSICFLIKRVKRKRRKSQITLYKNFQPSQKLKVRRSQSQIQMQNPMLMRLRRVLTHLQLFSMRGQIQKILIMEKKLAKEKLLRQELLTRLEVPSQMVQ